MAQLVKVFRWDRAVKGREMPGLTDDARPRRDDEDYRAKEDGRLLVG
jgi:hypothetical protein